MVGEIPHHQGIAGTAACHRRLADVTLRLAGRQRGRGAPYTAGGRHPRSAVRFRSVYRERRRQTLGRHAQPVLPDLRSAALLAGAEPYFLNTTRDNGYLPDFDAVPETVWRRCQLLYVCSPGNPTGAVLPMVQYQKLIELAEQYDFTIASDECYSELYNDEAAPPPGLLQAAAAMGNTDYRRCVVFHSLSKRSNAPGLRSGFVAGDAEILKSFLLYRTYHGCAMPVHVQQASALAWRDETHVRANRAAYREKFAAVYDILRGALDVELPPAGFYLWPRVPGDDAEFARRLYAEENLTVLPGSYLSREAHGHNPGAGHLRLALVAPLDECIDAARRIRRFSESLSL